MKKKNLIIIICAAVFLLPLLLNAEVKDLTPKIAFLLPAGGQRGTTVEVEVSGAQLNKPEEIILQNKQVKTEILHVHKSTRLSRPEKDERAAAIKAIALAKRGKAIPEELQDKIQDSALLWALKKPEAKPTEADLRRIQYEIYPHRQKVKPSRDMAKVFRAKLTIPKTVKPGRYEFRVRTNTGISNPLYFYVSNLPETLEAEPCTFDQSPVDEPFRLPVCINGQIYPGDVDIFQFRAREGQKLKLHAAARELKPYIADGVPG